MSHRTPPVLYVSRYGAGRLIEANGLAAVRISIGAPRWKLPYVIAGACRLLMPRRDMLKLEREDYLPLYLEILESHGVDRIRADLVRLSEEAGGKGLALLCFEKLAGDDWCHRTMFSEWWTEQTGEPVPELSASEHSQTFLLD